LSVFLPSLGTSSLIAEKEFLKVGSAHLIRMAHLKYNNPISSGVGPPGNIVILRIPWIMVVIRMVTTPWGSSAMLDFGGFKEEMRLFVLEKVFSRNTSHLAIAIRRVKVMREWVG
jgi:hypothetical protein